MLRLVDNSPKFVGEPIAEGQHGSQFYEAFTGPRVSARLGDTVRCSTHDGSAMGIIIALWTEGIRRKKPRCEILLFDSLPQKKKREQELFLTSESISENIAKVQTPIQVKSLAQWKEDQTKMSTSEKRRAKNVYFCEYGFMERTQTFTPAFDWNELYTEQDRSNLEEFQDRVIKFIEESATSKLSSRLKSKIKQQASRTTYVTKPDASEASESESMSDDTDAESEVIHSRARPQKQAKRTMDEDLEEVQKTPRKRVKTTQGLKTPSKNTQTPRKPEVLRTPGSRIRVKPALEVTPLPSRIRDLAKELNLSPHQLARQRLHVAEVPTSLPCRETEYESIFDQVESAILENESALLYVSGTPGTGKTATVREVITTLHQKVADGELFPFKYVEINGMKILDPTQAYSKLWETLKDQRVTASHALTLLQTEFTTSRPSRMPCVVLMDELDQLTTTKQEVIYNFFQWPNMPNTRLIVIAVSNTMDLPERTLAHKVSSRLGLTRIAFSAYTRPQLRTIIKSRLESVDAIDVDEAAIDYAALRVSAVNGDARRALDLCRRAFEIAEPGFTLDNSTPQKKASKAHFTGRITMAIMTQAYREMTSTPAQVYLKSLPFLSKVFLKAMITCVERPGLLETTLGEVIEEVTRICQVNTIKALDMRMGLVQPAGLIRTAENLAQGGVIYVEHGKGERSARMRFQVSAEDIRSSWAEDVEMLNIR